jgi:hypothetical protein
VGASKTEIDLSASHRRQIRFLTTSPLRTIPASNTYSVTIFPSADIHPSISLDVAL